MILYEMHIENNSFIYIFKNRKNITYKSRILGEGEKSEF